MYLTDVSLQYVVTTDWVSCQAFESLTDQPVRVFCLSVCFTFQPATVSGQLSAHSGVVLVTSKFETWAWITYYFVMALDRRTCLFKSGSSTKPTIISLTLWPWISIEHRCCQWADARVLILNLAECWFWFWGICLPSQDDSWESLLVKMPMFHDCSTEVWQSCYRTWHQNSRVWLYVLQKHRYSGRKKFPATWPNFLYLTISSPFLAYSNCKSSPVVCNRIDLLKLYQEFQQIVCILVRPILLLYHPYSLWQTLRLQACCPQGFM